MKKGLIFMGHAIEHFTFPEKTSKGLISAELNERVSAASWEEGGSGLDSPIRWIDKVLPDYESALAYIQEIDRGWYDQIAVKFKQSEPVKPTKKLQEMNIKLRELQQEYEMASRKVVAADFKSDFVGCKNCGSKINREYIKSNACPVCKYDMRSDTIKSNLTRMKERITKLRNEIKEEENKLRAKQVNKEKKAPVYWLVKIEYHV